MLVLTAPRRRCLAGAERGSSVLQIVLNSPGGRVRATEHAPRDPSRVLERRYGLAEIVERCVGVHAERLSINPGLTTGNLARRSFGSGASRSGGAPSSSLPRRATTNTRTSGASTSSSGVRRRSPGTASASGAASTPSRRASSTTSASIRRLRKPHKINPSRFPSRSRSRSPSRRRRARGARGSCPPRRRTGPAARAAAFALGPLSAASRRT